MPAIAKMHAEQTVKKINAREMRRHPTPAEQALWAYLRGNRLMGLHFRRQHVMSGFTLDFYCREILLAVEVDGAVHDQQREYDDERDTVLLRQGVLVLRFRNREVLERPREVIPQIEATVLSRLENPAER